MIGPGEIGADQVMTLDIAREDLRLALRAKEQLLRHEISADPFLAKRQRRKRDRSLPNDDWHLTPSSLAG